ncbi:MAG: hypothetical protein A2487_13415 [Candidatus Raymondbacteria bacterium RifOxyC12_full_50_8]|uniref:DUF5655 domain-containing protein n=1 Tax=Candidatus Raymondbacteria bacterium RIFOXYD12_FULL_49_13 TaxID=1817890 RepID=A0A1F7F7T8_UNCRA|nr:MAG: hypothetical protein A2248_13525 [Candidatus Raymondbacteria bacterium RIFOXYA2_FULL_49_16]OGJ95146.1 MAG: hypothetical protein A2350_09380 [Candidatus Raymondbacteria bacterium RifOxyB12_full_50_8]OGK00358.1 MAG: hypothetical protein A2487_13415 [Candidatus Raymondbacteria bacterium RifOxyC12_full_50_8]OGK02725.1 MAG: hypothetical protein A2519_09695 [Candidatus Raymondbacteria bacterium RIFOXYD12_FULL_49_13]OGP42371.1 MAG: hypothetical protein A2324_20365 [Candidatus Raymondbacteria b
MDASIYLNGKPCSQILFKKEDEFESIIYQNAKLLFGSKTILISKKLIKTLSLGNTIPDGFLFNLSDANNPQFYLIEIELSHHRFYDHIFPQLTKFIAFFKSSESRKSLIDKLFEIVTQTPDLNNEFKRLLGGREIFKTITDGVENSQNVLLILDEIKQEIDETKKAYAEWAKLVRIEIASFYKCGKDNICLLTPPFERVDLESVGDNNDIVYDEHYHFESSNEEIKEAYSIIKDKMIKFAKDIRINPQHYYISLAHSKNFVYIKPKMSKMQIIVTLPYNYGKKTIKYHKISRLSDSIQDFYNTKCFRLTVEDTKNIDEVVDLLKTNYKKTIQE